MKLRKIIVDNQLYRWKFEHGYERYEIGGETKEISTGMFTACADASKQDPLRIHFRTYDHPTLGNPMNNRVLPIVPEDLRTADINLYWPRWAANLIRYGLTHGWRPEHDKQPLVLTNGVEILSELLNTQETVNAPPIEGQ